MTPLELLELANKAFPELDAYYLHDADLTEVARTMESTEDEIDLYNFEGYGEPLADAIVCALLDVCKECTPEQMERQVLFIAAERMEMLQRQIGQVRNALVDAIGEVDKEAPHADT